MTPSVAQYSERVYAGVLGKIIGVYLGRPVEGWPYEQIEARFGEILTFVNDELGVPLIVADDDISGTFGFFRALADHGYPHDLDAAQVGQTWLNYIIENKTILWWGGLGRSTEHTAFLRLKNGIQAPRSGSAELNGTTLSEQIGAQIFIDAFAMAHPADPERAAALVRQAASVSHDGIALDAAAFLAALEALAFDVKTVDSLIEQARRYAYKPPFQRLIDDVLRICALDDDWRRVRAVLDERYGPRRYPGPCHIVTNHASVLAALQLGGDSFQRSVMIAASAGWDTDCNAGSVGCLNGIRLGLKAITAETDLRAPVADRLLVVTSDGGGCVSDAVQEAQKIIDTAARLRGESTPNRRPRFSFAFPSATQGFGVCPYERAPYPNVSVNSANGDHPGLVVKCSGVGPGTPASISAPVGLDPSEQIENFTTLASPTLYPGQRIGARLTSDDDALTAALYVLYRRTAGAVACVSAPPSAIGRGETTLEWVVPAVGNNPLLRVGLRIESSRRYDGTILIHEIDWDGAPESFEQQGLLMSSIWDTKPEALTAWVSSAQNFEADFGVTYSVSHPSGNGLATIGTRDWADYRVDSTLIFSLHRAAGLVARSRGHRRYYAAEFAGGTTVRIVKQDHATRLTLAEAAWAYDLDTRYAVGFECDGNQLAVAVEGATIITGSDADAKLASGGAGFFVNEGTLMADGFRVSAIRNRT